MSTLKLDTLSNKAGTASVPSDTIVSGTAKAWVHFDGTGTVAIRRAFNVGSITDNGTGNYTINFSTAMPDANYCYTCGVGNADHSSSTRTISLLSIDASGLQILTEATSGTNVDEPYINVAFFY